MRTDEAYRHECEVQTVARWTGQEIADYLKVVEKRRGRLAAERLLADVRKARQVRPASTGTSESNTTA